MSSAVSTTDAGRSALAAGLYVVLWRPPLHPHRRPPGDVLQAEAGSYDKNKTRRRREKHDKKQRKHLKTPVAVTALLALGMLTMLAGGLNAKIATITQPKAIIGTCMAITYVTGSLDKSTAMFCIGVPAGLAGIIDAASKDWWQKQLGGQQLNVWLGMRILNALRLAKYGFWAGWICHNRWIK
jgi:hypothetical protein